MWKKLVIIAILSVALLPFLIPVSHADALLSPTDDAWVDINEPNTNFDNATIAVDYAYQPSWVITRIGYLRFDLSLITADVLATTRLRLYVVAEPWTVGDNELALWSTGDDWNGSASGNGDETTLLWTNAPSLIASLDTSPAGDTGTWVEFSSATLASYINSQRAANGGDNIASFAVQWQGCSPCGIADNTMFEDRENAYGSGQTPQLDARWPTSLELKSFAAEPQPGAILTEWETLSETNVLGFDLYRADDPGGDLTRLNDLLIPAEHPGSPIGSQYQFVDRDVQVGVEYYYWLDVAHVEGSATRYGPVSAIAGAYRVYLPLIRH